MSQPEDIIKAVEQRVRECLKTLPKHVANDVVNFTKDNFRRQGFLGDSLQMWPKRKKVTKWGKTPRNNGRGILIDTGKLRRANRITKADWSSITIINSMPYAKAHNEGLRVGLIQQVKAHRRKRAQNNLLGARGKKIASGVTFVKAHKRRVMMNLPKRQFIGDSPYLRRNIQRTIALQIQKALK
jgi:hypothetical protein